MCTKHNFLRLIFIHLCLIIGIFSCKDDLEYKAPRIAGYYKIESLQADERVDLNNDGISSTNFKEEIILPGFVTQYNFSSPASYLEIRPTKYNDTQSQYIYIPFPHPHLTFEYTNSPNGPVSYMRNFINGMGYRYEYDSKHNKIQIDRTHTKDEEFWGKLMSIEAIPNNKLKVKISKNYYDFATASWVRVSLTGICTKVEN